MADFSVDLLSQGHQALLGQVAQEAKPYEKYFIGLFSVLALHLLWQELDDLIPRIMLEVLSNLVRFLNKI